MTDDEAKALAAQARIHAENSRLDVDKATTRVEHIRLSALAAEARRLADTLEIIAARPDVDRTADLG